ncbi:hypothetical protein [Clostridium cylindrosporum]|uniref:Uncharacterized protein n=1 Tax=Clostridium cylindrosporum DSM 605 TaxID=1121307 RepID=A0A0J8G360_CLOCY|nr:hypothetical protein [Clostridium cylindrosporum]KMT22141.1 hypothetical protein CLCY_4c01140 [Clostridium cylindrosporum DSM 605]
MNFKKSIKRAVALSIIASFGFSSKGLAASNITDAEAAALLTPARPGLPIAHKINTKEVAAPPLSLVKDQPVNPAYVPGLPGLVQGKVVKDDYGKPRKKNDGIIIRQSKVENGKVVIPAGGLVYLEDTMGGEVALQGEPIYYLGKQPTYIEYDMTIDVKKDVTIPAKSSVVVGGQVYYYYASVGHGTTSNHTLDVKTIAGTDWEWAFGKPVFSETQTNWWQGKHFNQLYNQGVVREASKEKLVFNWISGVRTDRMLMANKKVFSGFASKGQEWKVGNRTIRLSNIDEKAGTAKIEVLEGGSVVFEKTLGPLLKDRLIEDEVARKAILFEYKDVAGFIVPKDSFKDGKVQLKIYGDTFDIKYGEDYKDDKRFSVWPVGCPSGHNFGIMWTNKEPITIPVGESAKGPEGYFKIAVDDIKNGEVLGWHVEDREGNKSINLGGQGITNVDLVLGQGRVTGSDILKDVGASALTRTYDKAQSNQSNVAKAQAFPFSTVLITAFITLGIVGIVIEVRHRLKAK